MVMGEGSISMKFILVLLISFYLSCIGTSLFGTEDITRSGISFIFANAQIVSLDTGSYFSFDIMAAATGSGAMPRLGTGMVVFQYNSSVFGEWVKTNGNVIVSRGSLISTSPLSLYNMIVNDNQLNRLAVTFEYTAAPGGGNYLALDALPLVNVKLKIQNGGYAGISFATNSMIDEQYQDDNYTLLSPVLAVATENSIIPSRPLALTVSVLNSTVQLNWQIVPGCTYNVYSAADPTAQIWHLEATALTEASWNTSLIQENRFFYVTAHSNTAGRQP